MQKRGVNANGVSERGDKREEVPRKCIQILVFNLRGNKNLKFCVYVCVCVRQIASQIHTHTQMYIYVCTYMDRDTQMFELVYICMYIDRERERERDVYR